MPTFQYNDPLLSVTDTVAEVYQQPHLVYGNLSHVVYPYTTPNVGIGLPRPNIALFDFEFGLPLLLFVLLFAFVISFRKNFSNLAISVTSFKKFWSYQRAQVWGELPFTTLLFLFSIFPLSLLGTEILRSYLPVFLEDAFSTTFIYMSVAVGAIMLLRLICFRVVGTVSKEKQLFRDLVYTHLIFFATAGFIVVPVFLVKDFLNDNIAQSLLLPVAIFSLIVFFLYFFRTVRLFLQARVSFLFWILYFCTLEILPLTLIFKLLEDI